jgi:hypothetical protein
VAIVRPNEILHRRLVAQRVSTGNLDDPAAIVSWLGAVQAQDYLAALWAVGLRTRGAREEDVERSIADGHIVRTWPMRGTLHFVAAADARWMTELLAPRGVAAAQARLRRLGIDQAVLARARRVLIRHLEGGRSLTRPAAYRAFELARLAPQGQRGLHILWRLAHDGLICFGPREGKQQTFVLFEEWLPRGRRLLREEALAELAHRYFGGHGPATLRDFAWWSGLRLSEARLAVTLAGARIRCEQLNGVPHWFTDLPSARTATGDRAHALPAFDELLVGYADRSAALDSTTYRSVIAGGMFKPVLVGGGRLLGTWTRRLEREEVLCSIEPFGKLTRTSLGTSTRALERYASFLRRRLRRTP